MIEDIERHFEREFPKEGCGVILSILNDTVFVPLKNISNTPEASFELCPNAFVKLSLKGEILEIVHSHPLGKAFPSEHDISNCNSIGIPYGIYNFPDMEYHLLLPKKKITPLKGREYSFGEFDCFEAARDFYYVERDLYLPPRQDFEENWWEKDQNYFLPKNVENWNFYPVSDIQKYDLLVFSISSSVPNHCGVYLGDNLFYHHAVNRLSCEEVIKGIWMKSLTGAFRYAA